MAEAATPLRPRDERPVLALSGGVGGAKLALGLARILPPAKLTVVANTGDDFEHPGLHNPETGWGRRDETWSFMASLEELGGETWFRLGDRDLAMHVERTRRRKRGESLSEITADLTRRLGIATRILPMTDGCVSTRVRTPEGLIDFQHYFVGLKCAPPVSGFVFAGADKAVPHPDINQMLRRPDLRAIIICPSNPFISIDPILALPGLREALAASRAPVIAVAPIIAGRAVKGPTAKMMSELGLKVDALTVAAHYRGLIDGYVMDDADSRMAAMLDLPVETTRTLMQSLEDREHLARVALDLADRITAGTGMTRATDAG